MSGEKESYEIYPGDELYPDLDNLNPRDEIVWGPFKFVLFVCVTGLIAFLSMSAESWAYANSAAALICLLFLPKFIWDLCYANRVQLKEVDDLRKKVQELEVKLLGDN